MATVNPFDLLGDDDNDDPSVLIAAHEQKAAAKKAAPAAAPAPAPAKFPSKPLPPAQAVREARGVGAPARGGGGGRGGVFRGRGGRGGGFVSNRDVNGNADGFSGPYVGGGGDGGGGGGGWGEEGERVRPDDRERGPYRGVRRGGYGNVEGGEDERPPRRVYERRSGTGRGYESKRDGAGRGNWGSTEDAIAQESEEVVNKEEKSLVVERENEQEKSPENLKDKEAADAEKEEREKEEKEMTLEEFEKIREEKRKALLALKPEERKVNVDDDLKSMQQLEIKKGKDDIFIKLGSDKESRKQKENAERIETTKKSVSITEFLKPAEGGYYPGGRGRGRGRGRGAGRGDYGRGGYPTDAPPARASEVAIPIADPGQFPALGGK